MPRTDVDNLVSREGLLAAAVLDGAGGARRLGWDEVTAWRPDDGVLWLHLDHASPRARAWLADESGIDPIVGEALIAGDPRPRSLALQGGLLVIARGINLNAGAEPEDMVSVRIWVEERRIVTLRHRSVHAARALLDELAIGRGPRDPGEFLVRLLDRLLDRIVEATVAIDDAADELEDRVLAERRDELRHDLAVLRRRIIGLRRFLGPQREALARLVTEPAAWLGALERARLREDADRLMRVLEELDAARERAAVCQEELASATAELINRRLYVLSMATAIFLPLGLLTGLLGVEVGGVPLRDNPYGFAIVIGALLVMSGLQVWLFRRLRWL